MSGEVFDITYQTPSTFTCDGYDGSYDELTFEVVASPAHGSLSAFTNQTATPGHDTATIVYTPANGYSGPDSWSYRTKNGASPTSNFHDYASTTYGSSVTTWSSAIPSNTQYGDVMFAVLLIDGLVDPSLISAPTNWQFVPGGTILGSGGFNSNMTLAVFWKIAHAVDTPGSSRNWTVPGYGGAGGAAAIFSYQNVQGAAANGTPAFSVATQEFTPGQSCAFTQNPTVPTNGGVFAVFATDAGSTTSWSTPAGFASRAGSGSSAEPYSFAWAVFDKAQTSGGTTGTVTAVHNGATSGGDGFNGSLGVVLTYQLTNGNYSEPGVWNMNVRGPVASITPVVSIVGRSTDQSLGQKEITFHAVLDVDDPNRVNPIYFTYETRDLDLGTTAEGRGGIQLLANPGFEVNTTGWAASSNCSIARSTTQHSAGVASLAITATAGGDATATTSVGVAGFPVKAGRRYAPTAKFRANTTARTCQTQVRFFSSTGADLGVGTNVSVGVTDSNSAWTTDAGIGVSGSEAPANALFGAVEVVIKSAAASEVHYVDEVSVVTVLDYYRTYGYGLLNPGEKHFACIVTLTGNATYTIDKHIVVGLTNVRGGDGGNVPTTGTTVATLKLKKFVASTAPWGIPVQVATNKATDLTVRLIGRDTQTQELVFTTGSCLNGGTITNTTAGTGRYVKGTSPYFEDYVDVVYHPTSTFVGMDAFAYTVNDGTSTSTPVTVNVAVGDVPATPLLSINDQSVDVRSGDNIVTMDVRLSSASKSDTYFTFYTDDTGNGYRQNSLSANQSDIETDATGWGSGSNVNLSRVTTQSRSGAASLQMSSVASGTMSAKNNSLNSAAVLPGQSVSAWAWFRSAVTVRNVQVNLSWRDSSTGLISTTFGTPVADTTTGWTQATINGVAPANAAYVALEVVVNSTGGAAEVHYMDSAYIALGATTVVPGSNAGIGIIAMENENFKHLKEPVNNTLMWPKLNGQNTPLVPGGLLSHGVLFTNAFAPTGAHSHQCYVDFCAGDATTLGVIDDSMKAGNPTRATITPAAGGSIVVGPGPAGSHNLLTQANAAGLNWYAYTEAKPPTGDITANDQTANKGSVVAPGQTGGQTGKNYMARHFAPAADWAMFNSNPSHVRIKDAGSTSGFGSATTPSWPTFINDLKNMSPPVDLFWFSPTPANQGHADVPCSGNWKALNATTPSTCKENVDADEFLDKMCHDIMATDWYQAGGTLIIWWDEGDDPKQSTSTVVDSAGQHKPVLVVNKNIANQLKREESAHVNDWGLLRDIEDYFKFTPLGKAADGNVDGTIKKLPNIGKGILKSWLDYGVQNAQPHQDFIPVPITANRSWTLPAGTTLTKIPIEINSSTAAGSVRTLNVGIANITNASGITAGNRLAKLTLHTDSPPAGSSNGCMVGWHDTKTQNLPAQEKLLGKPFAAFRYYFDKTAWKTYPKTHRFLDTLINERLAVVSHVAPAWATGIPNEFTGREPATSLYAWDYIAQGHSNAYLVNLAQAYKQYNREVIVIFHHEPYDNSLDRNNPDDVTDPIRGNDQNFKDAFRRFSNIFASEGARKGYGGKVWIGYTTVMGNGKYSLPADDPMYPGDKYIDILCPDGYNWHGPGPKQGNWVEFQGIFEHYIGEAALRGLPVFVAETGCKSGGGAYSRKSWFEKMGLYLQTNPIASSTVKGFCYYHRLADPTKTSTGNEWRFITTNTVNGVLQSTALGEGLAGFSNAFYAVDNPFFAHRSFLLSDVHTATSGLIVDDVNVIEGIDASAMFKVTLSPVATSTVTVNYQTLPGTAAPTTDYTTTTGTLSFAAGETTKSVPVPIISGGTNDAEYEEFFLQLNTPSSGVALVRDTAICTIKESVTPGSVTTNIKRNAVAKAFSGSSVASIAVTVPAGISNGDVLLAFVTVPANVTITATGWGTIVKTGITSDTSATGCKTVVYKKTAASETGTWTFGFSPSSDCAVIVTAYGNVDATTPIANSDFFKGDLTPDIDILAPGMQGSVAGQMLVCGFGMNPTLTTALTFSTPSGMSYIESADPGASGPNQAVLALFEQVIPYTSFEPKISTIVGDDGGKNVGLSVLLNPLVTTVAPATIALRGTASAQFDVGGGTRASITVNKPTGTVDGDVMLAAVTCRSSITVTAPAGWTQIADQITTTVSNAGSRTTVFRKVAATEGASYVFSYSSTVDDGACAVILSFSGVDNTTPEDVTFTSVQSDTTTDTTINIPAITTVTDNAWHVYFAGVNPLTTTAVAVTGSQTAGYTEDYDSGVKGDGTNTLRVSLSAGHKAITPAGATTAFDVTTTNDGRNTGISVALRPGTTSTSSQNTITFRAASKASDVVTPGGVTSIAVPKPSTPSVLATNDVMLAFITIQGDADVSSAPTNWTVVRGPDTTASGSPLNSDCRVHTYKKVVTDAAAEPATYVWNFTTGCDVAAAIVAYYGVDNTTPVDTHGVTTTATSSLTITSPSIAPAVANEMLVMGHGHNPDTASTLTVGQTATMTQRTDTATKASGVNSNYNRATVSVFDAAAGSAGVAMGTHTSSVTDHGRNVGIAVLLRPSNATGGAPPPPDPSGGGGGGGVPTPPPPNTTANWKFKVLPNATGVPISSSGLVASATYPTTVWGHGRWKETIGGKANFWACKEIGGPGSFQFSKTLYRLTGPGGADIHINDWEDACYTVESGQGYIWILDHGFYSGLQYDLDAGVRNQSTTGGMLYKILEPSPDKVPGADGTVPVEYAAVYHYELSNLDNDPTHWTNGKVGNIEAMFAYRNQIHLIAKMKKTAGGADVFALPLSLQGTSGQTINLATKLTARLDQYSVSVADMSADNKYLLTYHEGNLEVRAGDGTSIANIITSKPIFTNNTDTTGFPAEGGCWYPRESSRNFVLVRQSGLDTAGPASELITMGFTFG